MSGELQVVVRVLEAYGLTKSDTLSGSDPFALIRFKGFAKLNSSRTSTIPNTQNPVWNQEISLKTKHGSGVLLLKVYDKDIGKNDLLGMVEIPLETLYGSGFQDKWFQLSKKKGGLSRQWISTPGKIHVQIWFGNSIDVINLPPPQYMMGLNQNQQGLMNNGFPLQQNQPLTSSLKSTPVVVESITTTTAPTTSTVLPISETSRTTVIDSNPSFQDTRGFSGVVLPTETTTRTTIVDSNPTFADVRGFSNGQNEFVKHSYQPQQSVIPPYLEASYIGKQETTSVPHTYSTTTTKTTTTEF